MAGDSPDRFVGNNNLGPVLDLVRDSLELLCDHTDGLALLPLLEALTTAQNHTQSSVERSLGLACNEGVVLLQDHTALRVAQNRPGNTAVLELVGRDLARKGTVGLVEDVLRGDFETFTEVLACEKEVEGRRGDDDLYSCVLADAGRRDRGVGASVGLQWTYQHWGQA